MKNVQRCILSRFCCITAQMMSLCVFRSSLHACLWPVLNIDWPASCIIELRNQWDFFVFTFILSWCYHVCPNLNITAMWEVDRWWIIVTQHTSQFASWHTPAEKPLFSHSAFDESLFALLWSVIISSISKADVHGRVRHNATHGSFM